MNATVLKRLVIASHDILAMGAAFVLAMATRYGFGRSGTLELWPNTLQLMAISGLTFFFFRMHRGLWRFVSLKDITTIAVLSALSIGVFTFLAFFLHRADGLPRSVPLVTWLLSIMFMAGTRMLYRLWKEGALSPHALLRIERKGTQRIVIIADAHDADAAIRALELDRSGLVEVLGIVDYKPSRVGGGVRGIQVLGTIDNLPSIVTSLKNAGRLDFLLLAGQRPPAAMVQKVAAIALPHRIPVRSLPPARIGASTMADFRNITLDDLLDRPPVALDMAALSHFANGQIALVTGAGGSIGAEITRQIAALSPQTLIILDHSEYALFEIEQDIRRAHPDLPLVPIIASIRDERRMRAIFAAHRPMLVFHAAALKHVPLVESNVCEATQTNILGSRIIADCALEGGARTMVMISTDKAIRPSSVMGATKRIAEAYCQALDLSGTPTRFITVRFGNVLGSTGSVVPIFRRQIEAGGPVTITHADMKRYFMTIEEATALVLQAAAICSREEAERGRILVLDMGEPVKIIDLARKMITLAGLTPDSDVRIEVTGMRRGEKLFEELFDRDEPTMPSAARGVFAAQARVIDRAELDAVMDALATAAAAGDEAACRRLMQRIVPELPLDSA